MSETSPLFVLGVSVVLAYGVFDLAFWETLTPKGRLLLPLGMGLIVGLAAILLNAVLTVVAAAFR